jgi:hypothetical protein
VFVHETLFLVIRQAASLTPSTARAKASAMAAGVAARMIGGIVLGLGDLWETPTIWRAVREVSQPVQPSE